MEEFFEAIAVTDDPSLTLDVAVRHGWEFGQGCSPNGRAEGTGAISPLLPFCADHG